MYVIVSSVSISKTEEHVLPFNNRYKLNMAKLCKCEYFQISYLNNIIGQS